MDKRGKQVRLSREVFMAVKQAAAKIDVTLQRYVEDVLIRHFRGGISENSEYTRRDSQQFNPEVDLPETFLRDCAGIYLASADEWAALARVVAAVSRGQESLRAGNSDRPRATPVIRPLPVEREDDSKDRTG